VQNAAKLLFGRVFAPGTWTSLCPSENKLSLVLVPHNISPKFTSVPVPNVQYVLSFRLSAKTLVNKRSAVAEMGVSLTIIDMGRKVGAAVSLFVGDLGPHLRQCPWAQAYLLTNLYSDASSHLAAIDMGRKVGAAVPLSRGSWVLHRTEYDLGRRLLPYQVAS